MACAFPQLDEGRCVSEELLAGRCERRAALVADEQRPAQPLFERTHAGADGCLADVKLLSRAHEALRPDDGEKRSCELDVHCRPVSKNYAAKYRLYSFVSRDGTSTIPPGKGKPAIVGSLKLHRSRLSSPPCFKDEMESHCAEHQPDDLPRWRRSQRDRLIADRLGLGVAIRSLYARQIAERLNRFLPDLTGRTVSGFWPFKGEPDLRPWLTSLTMRRARGALPVIAEGIVYLTNTPQTGAFSRLKPNLGGHSLPRHEPRNLDLANLRAGRLSRPMAVSLVAGPRVAGHY